MLPKTASGGGGPRFRVGSSGTTLTGLADHVSQREAGFLGRADIPAASSHLGSRSHRRLVSATHTCQVLEQDTPTSGLPLPPPSPPRPPRAASGRPSMGALLAPDTPSPWRAASGVPEILGDRKGNQVQPSRIRVHAKLAGPRLPGGVPLAVLFLILILGGPAPGGKWAPPPTFS